MDPKGRILVVDDVPQNIKVLGALLRKEGYEIEVALSGPEALEWTSQKPFDLILLDIMMPEMDGYEVCQILKSKPPSAKIPVIFLTAKYDSESVVKGFQAGAVDYVSKPFAAEELLIRVKTHLDLQNRTRELESLNLAKDKFFSIIAHDLVSPFQALLGFTDVLVQNYDSFADEERKQLLERVHQGAYNGYKLLSGLLEWSKHNMQKTSLQIRNFTLAMVVNDVVDFVQNSASLKNISIAVEIEPDLQIKADAEVVKIIIRNLVMNAIKFTPHFGLISVGASTDNHMATIRVTDTGIGIKPDVIPHLFKIDKSFTNQGTDGEIGTGLGLVLCHDFVKAHGGKIWVESQPVLGTTFFFTMPLATEK